MPKCFLWFPKGLLLSSFIYLPQFIVISYPCAPVRSLFAISSKSNPFINTKRRHEIGGFFILNSNPTREVFAKFVQEESADGSERLSSQSSLDVVIYQILSTADGIFVDIHMEASRSRFHPFSMKHSNTPTPFNRIYQVVKSRDIDCAENVHSSTKLLAVLDNTSRSRDSANLTSKGPTLCLSSDDGLQSSSIGTEQAHDILRLIKLSTSKK